jgi:hypothetical protein
VHRSQAPETVQRLLDAVEADPLLFEPNLPVVQALPAQVVEQGAFRGRESRQVAQDRLALIGPSRAMRQQGGVM